MSKERYNKYVAIVDRAAVMGCMQGSDRLSTLMDIESADRKFNLRLDDWLAADDSNFTHDFLGIENNIKRGAGFPATDFGFFVPRFAGAGESVSVCEMNEEPFDFEVIAEGSFEDEGFTISTIVIRLNQKALDEWIDSSILNCRATYETREEWERYKDNKEVKREVWERKILNKLKFAQKTGYSITQSVSEIFTVVLFEKQGKEGLRWRRT